MQGRNCSSAFLVVLFLFGAPAIFACGNKFLVKNGTMSKAQCLSMSKPGNIRMYRDATIKGTEEILNKDLSRALRSSGNDVKIVENRDEFESALKKDAYDVILVGLSAAVGTEKTLQESGIVAAKNAIIIPAVESENAGDVASAKEQFGTLMKDTDRTMTKLLRVGEALIALEKK